MKIEKISDYENYVSGHPGYSYDGSLMVEGLPLAKFGNGTDGLWSSGFATPEKADEFRAMPDGDISLAVVRSLLEVGSFEQKQADLFVHPHEEIKEMYSEKIASGEYFPHATAPPREKCLSE